MNREIKFRVWDNEYKYMNYKVLVGIYGDWEKVKDDKNYTACAMWIEPDKVDYKCEPHWAHFEPYHKDIHLMQYVGLKDKNGVEIYEGDIIEYKDSIGKHIEEVKFDKGCFYAGLHGGSSTRVSPKLINTRISKVIGNIYENEVDVDEKN